MKEANEVEKKVEARKCFLTGKLYLYRWSLQVQISFEFHDVGTLQEGDEAIDGLTRCVEAGMTLIGCSVERTAEVPDVGSCCRGATGDLRVYRLSWKSPLRQNEFKRNARFVLRPDTQPHNDEYELPEAIPVEFDIVMIDQRKRFLIFIARNGR